MWKRYSKTIPEQSCVANSRFFFNYRNGGTAECSQWSGQSFDLLPRRPEPGQHHLRPSDADFGLYRSGVCRSQLSSFWDCSALYDFLLWTTRSSWSRWVCTCQRVSASLVPCLPDRIQRLARGPGSNFIAYYDSIYWWFVFFVQTQIAHRDIEYLWLLVQKFSLVYCLQEVIWALVRTDVANIPGFDILQYGILRFKQYHRNKYQIMSMQIIWSYIILYFLLMLCVQYTYMTKVEREKFF